MNRAIVGLVLATAVAARADDVAVRLPITTERLANGLEVILAPDPGVSTAITLVRYRVGSADDAPGHAGLARLIEHVMFRRSRHVVDAERLLDAAGGWGDATTTPSATSFVDSVPEASLELALYLEADRMTGPATPELGAARDALANERADAIEAALWPARAPSSGTPAEFATITPAEVTARWADRYVPANATLVIVGRFDAPSARALVHRYFDWIPARAHPAAIELGPIVPLAEPVELASFAPTPRLTIALRADRSAELAIAARLLGTGHGARLYRRLVTDDRLASELHVDLVPEPRGGELILSIDLRAGATHAAVRAAIAEELARLRSVPVDDAELARARTLTERELLVGLEDLAFRAGQLASGAESTGAPRWIGELRAQLAAVTPAALRQAAQRWLDVRAAVTLTAGPR